MAWTCPLCPDMEPRSQKAVEVHIKKTHSEPAPGHTGLTASLSPQLLPTKASSCLPGSTYRCRIGECGRDIPVTHDKTGAYDHVKDFHLAGRQITDSIECGWQIGDGETCATSVTLINLGRHIAEQHGPKAGWMCPLCPDMEPVRESSVQRHIRSVHDDYTHTQSCLLAQALFWETGSLTETAARMRALASVPARQQAYDPSQAAAIPSAQSALLGGTAHTPALVTDAHADAANDGPFIAEA
ncbi:hypothetical protein WOLCODRAFT_157787 [Wolfiporia cocos MD-104 SS10]|uniref:C2H2-type domain-containing protein n=1 Tax=Wolfiporia cocos (strain MD-104) TaxID=742152 RepID=A0A2H3J5Y4_WOLCO|nr:hypothetical protein WOLCODRAFT_157787 [Wolfiporia cocos MD-104 SS10]